jgi:hypothetical protein
MQIYCYSIDNYYGFVVLSIMYCYLNNCHSATENIVLLKLWLCVLYIVVVFVLKFLGEIFFGNEYTISNSWSRH